MEYFNKIIKELSREYNSSDTKFQYLEVGQLLTHGFSVTQSNQDQNSLILKILDETYDNKRNYVLHPPVITEKKIALDTTEKQLINELLNTEVATIKTGAIVLDGLYCQLKFNERKLNWNIDEEMNTSLNKLVNFLRAKVV